MESLHIIGDEHQSIAAIMHAIRYMLKEVGAGKLQADLKLFQAMVHYLDAYAEQRHHPKEDILFDLLAKRTDKAANSLAQLAEQHGAAPQRIAALQQALDAYLADAGKFAQFAQAFDAYAEFYRNHMMLEEDVVLPLARQHLTAADWAAVDAGFREEMQSKSGKDGKHEDFAGLFSRLVDAAPAPIGLGSGPFKG
ncbi:MAG: hemerythrin domain-containing protein [Rhodocyclaceae bacterium]|nr:hemerythrin domain-containing protein [Rhodocyclaceae bacterium]MBX3670845.1 hemerythrin domain-containing protein [Rhodocyclaceae bacterium]